LNLRVATSVRRRIDLHVASLITLIVVALALGALQYRWIDEVSEAQENRTRSRLREEVARIGDALDTEIARAVLVFTIPPGPDEGIQDRLDETWATWRRDAPSPGVVSGLRLVEPGDTGWHTREWGDAGAFDRRSVPEVRSDLSQPGPRGSGLVRASARTVTKLVDGQPAVVSPLLLPNSPRMAWVVIRFDRRHITDTLFPRLVQQHATREDRMDFQFQIGPSGLTANGVLVVADQFQFRPDCVLSGRVDGSMITVTRSPARIGNSGSAAPSVSSRPQVVEVGRPSLPALLRAAASCRVPASPSSDALMQVSVRHAEGNASDVFIDFRRRNMLLSGLVVVVLLAALTALIVSTQRARRLAWFQTVVAAGISHELRTPLASLNVAADHLKNGHVINADQAAKYGEIIDAQARRLRHVIDQALALGRPGQSKGALRWQAVSISEAACAACDALAPAMREAGITMEHRIAPGLPPIAADPDLVVRCLTNLIENSIKYARSGRWLCLSAQWAHQRGRPVIEVAIEDRGPGIADDEVMAVFEPFFRGSSARHTRQPGSGLGLAIVKSAVEAHGGWLVLEPVVPHGCKFRLFFPALDARDATSAAGSEEPRNDVTARIAD
jgi:signal transduction histidine kinase